MLLYNAEAISVLTAGWKHTANSGGHSLVTSYLWTIVFHACRSDVISTDNSFMHIGMTFWRQASLRVLLLSAQSYFKKASRPTIA